MEKDDSIHQIDTELKLQTLLKIIEDGEEITGKFLFETEELRSMFLSEMIPQGVDFEDKYYYFDKERNLHVAESEEGFLWVSTMGLVPTEKYSDNMYVNAFVTQKEVMLALLESAERLLSTVNVRTIPYFMHILFWRWKRCQNILKRFRGRLMKHISNMMQMNRTVHASLFQKRQ